MRGLIAVVAALVVAGAALPGPASAAATGTDAATRSARVVPAAVAPAAAAPDRLVRFSPVAPVDHRAVLLVHGWLSTSLPAGLGAARFADSPFARPVQWRDGSGAPVPRGFTASLQNRLEALPGTAVYAFDYSANASAWVGSTAVAEHLADAIRQIAASVDGPIDVVTHSMGGLALRYALEAAPELAARLGEVVTVATPSEGSEIAGVAVSVAGGIRTTMSANPVLQNLVLPAIAAACNAELLTDARSGCDLPPIIRTGIAALGQGGTALRAGSSELADLPDWPRGVSVHAIAASAVVTLPLSVPVAGPAPELQIRLGDGLVTESSATAGAGERTVVSCTTTLPPGATGVTAAVFGGVEAPPFGGPCSHDALFSNLQIVDAVLASLSPALPDGRVPARDLD